MNDVRIICISGMVEEDKVAELKEAGANDFMHKPFEVERLWNGCASISTWKWPLPPKRARKSGCRGSQAGILSAATRSCVANLSRSCPALAHDDSRPIMEGSPSTADTPARLAQLESDFQRALEAEKLEAMAEFAAGAGHEINNPLDGHFGQGGVPAPRRSGP